MQYSSPTKQTHINVMVELQNLANKLDQPIKPVKIVQTPAQAQYQTRKQKRKKAKETIKAEKQINQKLLREVREKTICK